MGWTTRCFDTCMYWYEKKHLIRSPWNYRESSYCFFRDEIDRSVAETCQSVIVSRCQLAYLDNQPYGSKSWVFRRDLQFLGAPQLVKHFLKQQDSNDDCMPPYVNVIKS